MDVILTTKCNLKCDGCCYLFNKYKDGEFLDADKIIANMNKIKLYKMSKEGFSS